MRTSAFKVTAWNVPRRTAIQEHVEAGGVAINKTLASQRLFSRLQVATAEENLYIEPPLHSLERPWQLQRTLAPRQLCGVAGATFSTA